MAWSLSVSSRMARSEGPTPAMGEMMPPSTWYTPWYCPVASMLITSFTLATTQIRFWFRVWSAQMEHSSSSEIIRQRLQ